MAEKKTVTIEQIGSPLRRPKDQRQTLIGLGLEQNASPQNTGRYTVCSWHDPQSEPSRACGGRSLNKRIELGF